MNDVLKQLREEISRKEAEITKAQAELAELTTALRVFQRMRGIPPEPQDIPDAAVGKPTYVPEPKWKPGLTPAPDSEMDLAGTTMLNAACQILREHAANGQPSAHYKDVAIEAKRRGYQGRSEKALIQSFWATMNRAPDIFKKMGHGHYALTERAKKTESAEVNGVDDR